MKIAVMSDIHGNNMALDAVMSDIKKEQVDKILILGDMISDFPQATKAVMDTVKDFNAFVIRGNREEYMLEYSNGEHGSEWEKYRQLEANLKTYRLLSEDDIDYFRFLPKQIALWYSEIFSLRMVHGSPFSQVDSLYEDDEEQLVRSLDEINEKILLCGHTHCQMVKHIGGKTVLNPGAVGINFTKKCEAQYAIIEEKDGKILFELKSVPYDFEAFKRTCDMKSVWVRLCLKSMEDGATYNIMFLNEAKERCNTWPIPNDVFDCLVGEWEEKGII